MIFFHIFSFFVIFSTHRKKLNFFLYFLKKRNSAFSTSLFLGQSNFMRSLPCFFQFPVIKYIITLHYKNVPDQLSARDRPFPLPP